MSENWEIYGFRYARHDDRDEGTTFIDGQPGVDIGGMDYFFWALRSGERTIVVDTGANSAKMPPRGRRSLIEPEAALAGVGIDAAEVTEVFLTHAHWDHIGNLDLFPKAHFWMQAREMASITGPDMTYKKIRGAYQPDEVQRLVGLLYENRLTFLEGDGAFAPGVDYVLLAGHSAGQTGLRVQTERGPVLLASDAVHYYREIAEELTFAAFNDVKEMLASLRRCRAEVDGDWSRLLPGHDPIVSAAYPAETHLENGEPVALRLDLAPTGPLELRS